MQHNASHIYATAPNYNLEYTANLYTHPYHYPHFHSHFLPHPYAPLNVYPTLNHSFPVQPSDRVETSVLPPRHNPNHHYHYQAHQRNASRPPPPPPPSSTCVALPKPPTPPLHIYSTIESHVGTHRLFDHVRFDFGEYVKHRSYVLGWIAHDSNQHQRRPSAPNSYTFNSETVLILDASVSSLLHTTQASRLPVNISTRHSPCITLASGMFATCDIPLQQPILVEHPALIASYLFPTNPVDYKEEVYASVWARLGSSGLKHGLRRFAEELRGPRAARSGPGVGNPDWAVLEELLAVKGLGIKMELPQGSCSELTMHRAVFLEAGRCNYSSTPTARYEWDTKTLALTLYPLKPIKTGEEITIAYQQVTCTNPRFSLRGAEGAEDKRKSTRRPSYTYRREDTSSYSPTATSMCRCLSCALAFVNASPYNGIAPPPVSDAVADADTVADADPCPGAPPLRISHQRPVSLRDLIYATGNQAGAGHDNDDDSDEADGPVRIIPPSTCVSEDECEDVDDSDNTNGGDLEADYARTRSPSPHRIFSPSTNTSQLLSGILGLSLDTRVSVGGQDHPLPELSHRSQSQSQITNRRSSFPSPSPILPHDPKFPIWASTSVATDAASAAGLPTFQQWLDDPSIPIHVLVDFHAERLLEIEKEELRELEAADRLDELERKMVAQSIYRRQDRQHRARGRRGRDSVSSASSDTTTMTTFSSSSHNSVGSSSTTATSVTSDATSYHQPRGTASVSSSTRPTRTRTAGAKARRGHLEMIAMCIGALGMTDMFRRFATMVRDGKLARAAEKEDKARRAKVGAGVLNADGRSAGQLERDDAETVQSWINRPDTFPIWGKKRT